MAKKKGNKPRSQWTKKAKAEALAVYLETGSSIITSGKTGIPASTIRNWMASDPEWMDAGGQVTRAIRDLVRSEARAVAERAFAILLSTDDPATMNAANNTIKTMATTASLLEGEPTERHEHITPEQVQESARKRFGIDLGRVAADAVPVPEGVPN